MMGDLYKWGNLDLLCSFPYKILNLSLYVVNYTILIEQSMEDYDGENYYYYFSPLHIQSLILNIYTHPRGIIFTLIN